MNQPNNTFIYPYTYVIKIITNDSPPVSAITFANTQDFFSIVYNDNTNSGTMFLNQKNDNNCALRVDKKANYISILINGYTRVREPFAVVDKHAIDILNFDLTRI